ncbi:MULTISPECIES: hypothetical protein [unclassified Streptomyces]|uniref:hypothetical protein n=1 Tax=unclassified Streptomyces TaxID=2593676 RepID=UPI0011E7B2CE|nr:hypothetical protein [Streptomyces sp. sk2.1]TXS68829.1 hypothetical protein EAO76_26855 [Streptomyces sp. sk2.1]
MPLTDHRRRRLGIAAGTALLTLTVAGCSGLGRTAVGPVIYTTQRNVDIAVNSPPVKGCHRLAPSGAKAVFNETLIDIILYRTFDCTGPGTTYLATGLSDFNPPSVLPWRSFSTVH